MVADDRVSGTDADRHDDISRNGSYGFGGIADSAERGDLDDVISEGTNVDVFAEAYLLGFGFECLGLIAKVLVALFVFPLGFWWKWLANVWPATELEAEFCGGEAFAGGGIFLLRQILRLVAKAAGVIAVVAV